MRFLLSILALTFFLSSPAFSDQTVTEKLDQRDKDFGKKADPQKQKDYKEGIELVRKSGVLERAKNVGDMAPDFILPSATGEQVTLSKLLKTGPVVMIWYRGEWCPYCNIYLEDIQAHIDDFKSTGAHVVAISPESADRGWTLQDKKSIEFYVLSDIGSHVAQEYGVAYELPPKIAEYYQKGFDIHAKNKDDSNLLPLAASYVINQDGKITYAFLDANYKKRAETSVLLEEVQKLKIKK